MRARASSFFNDPASSQIYTLSLHDALPISQFDDAAITSCLARAFAGLTLAKEAQGRHVRDEFLKHLAPEQLGWLDRKSTRLNSSHSQISYAVFCLKKKKQSARPR